MDNININRVLEITNEFLQVPSIIEFEKPFLIYLNERAKNLGYDTFFEDKYLVVKTKSKLKRPNYLFSAHIDRHGFILNENGDVENAAYYFKKKYNLKFNRDSSDFFLSCAQRHTKENVSSYDVNSGDILNEFKSVRYNLDWKNKLVSFDLDKNLNNCDRVFMLNSKIEKKNNLFFGQIDNVISVAVMFYILESSNFEDEMIFTTREEIGLSYSCVLDYVNNHDNFDLKLIVLDTSPYENFNLKEKGFLVLREGDENGSFDLNLVDKIKSFLDLKKIPYYFKSSSNGMTELGRVSTESKGKINGATLQIPSMNYHTTYETSTIESLENYIRVILNLNNK